MSKEQFTWLRERDRASLKMAEIQTLAEVLWRGKRGVRVLIF